MNGSARGEGSSRRDLQAIVLVTAGVALLVALPSIVNGFVYDDVWIIERNDIVHSLRLRELLTSPYWPAERGGAMWRPVSLLAFALQWAAGGGGAGIFHVVNIGLSALVAGLVALLAARLFTARIGLFTGLLFAAHPAHVEVTANIVGQAELIAAVGYLGALLAAWERSGTRGRAQWMLLAVVGVAVGLGLGGKEHVVTYPAALLLVWWLRGCRDRVSFLRVAGREWPVLLVSVLVIGLYLVLRGHFAQGVTATGGIAAGLERESFASRASVMLPVSLLWLKLLFFPLQLSADYSPLHLVPEPNFGLAHLVAIVIWFPFLTLVWMRRNRWRVVFSGVALFVITISVVSNVIVPLEVLFAERLLFFPSVGWALAIGGTLAAVHRSASLRSPGRATAVLVSAVLVLFAARSIQRTTVWRNNEIFFDQLLQDAPNSFRSHWAIGWRAFERGDTVLGEREMLTAVRLNPYHPQLVEDLGRRYAAGGRYEPAIPLLEQAVAMDSARLSSALPLALSLARSGKVPDALLVLDAMTRLHGETRGLAVVRSETLMLGGDPERALAVLTRLIEREPRVWSVRLMAVEAAVAVGRCEVALAQADTARQLAPESEHQGIEAALQRVANGKAPCK